jgi:hypothetical protein
VDPAVEEERDREEREATEERIAAQGTHEDTRSEVLMHRRLVHDDLAAEAALDADDLLGLGIDALGDELELL